MCGHFRSRDEDSGHTTGSAIPKNLKRHANFMAPSSIEVELLLIEVLHCRNKEFCAFLLLWPWPWPLWPLCTNLTHIPWRCTRKPKINILCQVF